jgi:hypothetical protein
MLGQSHTHNLDTPGHLLHRAGHAHTCAGRPDKALQSAMWRISAVEPRRLLSSSRLACVPREAAESAVTRVFTATLNAPLRE